MMIEERLEDTGRQIAMGVGRAGGGLALRVGEKTAGWFLRLGGRGLSAMRGVMRRGRDTGRMSEKRLQRVAGGDVHTVELERRQVRAVVRSLHRAGVRYSVERDGRSAWVHFEGRDLDHVTHAVRRALQDVGHELRIDGQHPSGRRGSEDTRPPRTTEPNRDEPQAPAVSSPAAYGETMTTADATDRQTMPKPSPSEPHATAPPKPAAWRSERRVSRRDTLAELRARIERKLAGKPVRPVATRKPDRPRSR